VLEFSWFRDVLRPKIRFRAPVLPTPCGDATCDKLLYDAFKFGLEAVLNVLLLREGRGRVRFRRGVNELDMFRVERDE